MEEISQPSKEEILIMANYEIYGFVLTSDKEVADVWGIDRGDGLELFYYDDPYDFIGIYGLSKLPLQPISNEEYDVTKANLLKLMIENKRVGALNVSPETGYFVEDVDTFEYSSWEKTSVGVKQSTIIDRGDVCTIEPDDSTYQELMVLMDMSDLVD